MVRVFAAISCTHRRQWLIDVARRVIIDPRKLTGYALDPDHPVGCHKARMFQQVLGFTGETLALCFLSPQQFFVVWRAETRTWVPVSEQIVAVVTHLPEEMEREVLDFARYLHTFQRRLWQNRPRFPETVGVRSAQEG